MWQEGGLLKVWEKGGREGGGRKERVVMSLGEWEFVLDSRGRASEWRELQCVLSILCDAPYRSTPQKDERQ